MKNTPKKLCSLVLVWSLVLTMVPLQGLDLVQAQSTSIDVTGDITDNIDPNDATNFQGTSGNSSANLTWTRSTSPDLADQLVYYKLQSAVTYDGPVSVGFADQSTTITGLIADETYDFLLVSEDIAGNQSTGVSASVLITSGGGGIAPGQGLQVSAVTNLEAQIVPQGVALTWDEPTTYASLEIFRLTAPSTTFIDTPLALINPGVETYLDEEATLGNTYIYGVRGKDSYGNISPMNTVLVSYSDSADVGTFYQGTNLSVLFANFYPTEDSDGDGIADSIEIQYGLDPTNGQDGLLDQDGDGIATYLEILFRLNPFDPGDAALDPDGNGLTFYQEITLYIFQFDVTIYRLFAHSAVATTFDPLIETEIFEGFDPRYGGTFSGEDTFDPIVAQERDMSSILVNSGDKITYFGSLFMIPKEGTFEIWAEGDGSTGSTRTIVDSSVDDFNFSITYNEIERQFTTEFGETIVLTSPDVRIDNGIPAHLALTWKEDGEVIFYVNGVPVDSAPYQGVNHSYLSRPVTLGARSDGAEVFNGNLLDLAVFDTQRNPLQIREDYSNELGKNGEHLFLFERRNMDGSGYSLEEGLLDIEEVDVTLVKRGVVTLRHAPINVLRVYDALGRVYNVARIVGNTVILSDPSVDGVQLFVEYTHHLGALGARTPYLPQDIQVLVMDDGVRFIDENGLVWMTILYDVQGIFQQNIVITDIVYINGVVQFVTNQGLYILDLISNTVQRIDAQGIWQYNGGIDQRGEFLGYTLIQSLSLPSSVILDQSTIVLNGITYLALATPKGVVLVDIRDPFRVQSVYSHLTPSSVTHVLLDGTSKRLFYVVDGVLYGSQQLSLIQSNWTGATPGVISRGDLGDIQSMYIDQGYLVVVTNLGVFVLDPLTLQEVNKDILSIKQNFDVIVKPSEELLVIGGSFPADTEEYVVSGTTLFLKDPAKNIIKITNSSGQEIIFTHEGGNEVTLQGVSEGEIIYVNYVRNPEESFLCGEHVPNAVYVRDTASQVRFVNFDNDEEWCVFDKANQNVYSNSDTLTEKLYGNGFLFTGTSNNGLKVLDYVKNRVLQYDEIGVYNGNIAQKNSSLGFTEVSPNALEDLYVTGIDHAQDGEDTYFFVGTRKGIHIFVGPDRLPMNMYMSSLSGESQDLWVNSTKAYLFYNNDGDILRKKNIFAVDENWDSDMEDFVELPEDSIVDMYGDALYLYVLTNQFLYVIDQETLEIVEIQSLLEPAEDGDELIQYVEEEVYVGSIVEEVPGNLVQNGVITLAHPISSIVSIIDAQGVVYEVKGFSGNLVYLQNNVISGVPLTVIYEPLLVMNGQIPSSIIIQVLPEGVLIIDGSTESPLFALIEGEDNLLPVSNIQSVAFQGGMLMLGTDQGVVVVNFLTSEAYLINNLGTHVYRGILSEANLGNGYVYVNGYSLPNIVMMALAAGYVDGIPYMIMGGGNQLSLWSFDNELPYILSTLNDFGTIEGVLFDDVEGAVFLWTNLGVVRIDLLGGIQGEISYEIYPYYLLGNILDMYVQGPYLYVVTPTNIITLDRWTLVPVSTELHGAAPEDPEGIIFGEFTALQVEPIVTQEIIPASGVQFGEIFVEQPIHELVEVVSATGAVFSVSSIEGNQILLDDRSISNTQVIVRYIPDLTHIGATTSVLPEHTTIQVHQDGVWIIDAGEGVQWMAIERGLNNVLGSFEQVYDVDFVDGVLTIGTNHGLLVLDIPQNLVYRIGTYGVYTYPDGLLERNNGTGFVYSEARFLPSNTILGVTPVKVDGIVRYVLQTPVGVSIYAPGVGVFSHIIGDEITSVSYDSIHDVLAYTNGAQIYTVDGFSDIQVDWNSENSFVNTITVDAVEALDMVDGELVLTTELGVLPLETYLQVQQGVLGSFEGTNIEYCDFGAMPEMFALVLGADDLQFWDLDSSEMWTKYELHPENGLPSGNIEGVSVQNGVIQIGTSDRGVITINYPSGQVYAITNEGIELYKGSICSMNEQRGWVTFDDQSFQGEVQGNLQSLWVGLDLYTIVTTSEGVFLYRNNEQIYSRLGDVVDVSFDKDYARVIAVFDDGVVTSIENIYGEVNAQELSAAPDLENIIVDEHRYFFEGEDIVPREAATYGGQVTYPDRGIVFQPTGFQGGFQTRFQQNDLELSLSGAVNENIMLGNEDFGLPGNAEALVSAPGGVWILSENTVTRFNENGAQERMTSNEFQEYSDGVYEVDEEDDRSLLQSETSNIYAPFSNREVLFTLGDQGLAVHNDEDSKMILGGEIEDIQIMSEERRLLYAMGNVLYTVPYTLSGNEFSVDTSERSELGRVPEDVTSLAYEWPVVYVETSEDIYALPLYDETIQENSVISTEDLLYDPVNITSDQWMNFDFLSQLVVQERFIYPYASDVDSADLDEEFNDYAKVGALVATNDSVVIQGANAGSTWVTFEKGGDNFFSYAKVLSALENDGVWYIAAQDGLRVLDFKANEAYLHTYTGTFAYDGPLNEANDGHGFEGISPVGAIASPIQKIVQGLFDENSRLVLLEDNGVQLLIDVQEESYFDETQVLQGQFAHAVADQNFDDIYLADSAKVFALENISDWNTLRTESELNSSYDYSEIVSLGHGGFLLSVLSNNQLLLLDKVDLEQVLGMSGFPSKNIFEAFFPYLHKGERIQPSQIDGDKIYTAHPIESVLSVQDDFGNEYAVDTFQNNEITLATNYEAGLPVMVRYVHGVDGYGGSTDVLPAVAAVLVKATGVDIMDVVNNSHWMEFDKGEFNMVDPEDLLGVFTLNAAVYLPAASDLTKIDFIHDEAKQFREDQVETYNSGIIGRNSGFGYGTFQDDERIISTHRVRVGTAEYRAVGTDRGVIFLSNEDGQGGYEKSVRTTTNEEVIAVYIDEQHNTLFYATNENLFAINGIMDRNTNWNHSTETMMNTHDGIATIDANERYLTVTNEEDATQLYDVFTLEKLTAGIIYDVSMDRDIHRALYAQDLGADQYAVFNNTFTVPFALNEPIEVSDNDGRSLTVTNVVDQNTFTVRETDGYSEPFTVSYSAAFRDLPNLDVLNGRVYIYSDGDTLTFELAENSDIWFEIQNSGGLLGGTQVKSLGAQGGRIYIGTSKGFHMMDLKSASNVRLDTEGVHYYQGTYGDANASRSFATVEVEDEENAFKLPDDDILEIYTYEFYGREMIVLITPTEVIILWDGEQESHATQTEAVESVYYEVATDTLYITTEAQLHSVLGISELRGEWTFADSFVTSIAVQNGVVLGVDAGRLMVQVGADIQMYNAQTLESLGVFTGQNVLSMEQNLALHIGGNLTQETVLAHAIGNIVLDSYIFAGETVSGYLMGSNGYMLLPDTELIFNQGVLSVLFDPVRFGGDHMLIDALTNDGGFELLWNAEGNLVFTFAPEGTILIDQAIIDMQAYFDEGVALSIVWDALTGVQVLANGTVVASFDVNWNPVTLTQNISIGASLDGSLGFESTIGGMSIINEALSLEQLLYYSLNGILVGDAYFELIQNYLLELGGVFTLTEQVDASLVVNGYIPLQNGIFNVLSVTDSLGNYYDVAGFAGSGIQLVNQNISGLTLFVEYIVNADARGGNIHPLHLDPLQGTSDEDTTFDKRYGGEFIGEPTYQDIEIQGQEVSALFIDEQDRLLHRDSFTMINPNEGTISFWAHPEEEYTSGKATFVELSQNAQSYWIGMDENDLVFEVRDATGNTYEARVENMQFSSRHIVASWNNINEEGTASLHLFVDGVERAQFGTQDIIMNGNFPEMSVGNDALGNSPANAALFDLAIYDHIRNGGLVTELLPSSYQGSPFIYERPRYYPLDPETILNGNQVTIFENALGRSWVDYRFGEDNIPEESAPFAAEYAGGQLQIETPEEEYFTNLYTNETLRVRDEKASIYLGPTSVRNSHRGYGGFGSGIGFNGITSMDSYVVNNDVYTSFGTQNGLVLEQVNNIAGINTLSMDVTTNMIVDTLFDQQTGALYYATPESLVMVQNVTDLNGSWNVTSPLCTGNQYCYTTGFSGIQELAVDGDYLYALTQDDVIMLSKYTLDSVVPYIPFSQSLIQNGPLLYGPGGPYTPIGSSTSVHGVAGSVYGVNGLFGPGGLYGPDGLYGYNGIYGVNGLFGPNGIYGINGPYAPGATYGIGGLYGPGGPYGPGGIYGPSTGIYSQSGLFGFGNIYGFGGDFLSQSGFAGSAGTWALSADTEYAYPAGWPQGVAWPPQWSNIGSTVSFDVPLGWPVNMPYPPLSWSVVDGSLVIPGWPQSMPWPPVWSAGQTMFDAPQGWSINLPWPPSSWVETSQGYIPPSWSLDAPWPPQYPSLMGNMAACPGWPEDMAFPPLAWSLPLTFSDIDALYSVQGPMGLAPAGWPASVPFPPVMGANNMPIGWPANTPWPIYSGNTQTGLATPAGWPASTPWPPVWPSDWPTVPAPDGWPSSMPWPPASWSTGPFGPIPTGWPSNMPFPPLVFDESCGCVHPPAGMDYPELWGQCPGNCPDGYQWPPQGWQIPGQVPQGPGLNSCVLGYNPITVSNTQNPYGVGGAYASGGPYGPDGLYGPASGFASSGSEYGEGGIYGPDGLYGPSGVFGAFSVYYGEGGPYAPGNPWGPGGEFGPGGDSGVEWGSCDYTPQDPYNVGRVIESPSVGSCTPTVLRVFPEQGRDSDGDSVPDSHDDFPNDASEWIDSDGDGIGDNADTDDDNDLVPDNEDQFPHDASESRDFDYDCIGDNADPDDDNDGVQDPLDNCPLDPNPSQGDEDQDGIGDVCDSLGLSCNPYEQNVRYGAAQYTPAQESYIGMRGAVYEIYLGGPAEDTDRDGLLDPWEIMYFNDIDVTDGSADSDGDGLLDREEYDFYTDPFDVDTDNDGLSDYDEIRLHRTNPNYFDTDGDGLNDRAEIEIYGTNPLVRDTDGDGYIDGIEISAGSDPLDPRSIPNDVDGDGIGDNWSALYFEDSSSIVGGGVIGSGFEFNGTPGERDTDQDGLTDLIEYKYNTNPLEPDTDGDGYPDGEEILIMFTDPLNPFDPGEDEEYIRISNWRDGDVSTSARPLVQGSSSFEETGVEVYSINALQKTYDVFKGSTDEGGHFLTVPDEGLRDGQYNMMALAYDPRNSRILAESMPVQIIIDTLLDIPAPTPTRIDQLTISKDDLENGVRFNIPEPQPSVRGLVYQGSTVTASWKSLLLSSALIADSSTGTFVVYPPDDLPYGKHTVYLVAEHPTLGAKSPYVAVEFEVVPGFAVIMGDLMKSPWFLLFLALMAGGGYMLWKRRKEDEEEEGNDDEKEETPEKAELPKEQKVLDNLRGKDKKHKHQTFRSTQKKKATKGKQ